MILNINPGYRLDLDGRIEDDVPMEFDDHSGRATTVHTEDLTQGIAKSPAKQASAHDTVRQLGLLRVLCHNTTKQLFADKGLSNEHLQAIESGLYISAERKGLEQQMTIEHEEVPF